MNNLDSTITLRAGEEEDAPLIKHLALTQLGRSPSLNLLSHLLDNYPSVLAFDEQYLCGFVFGMGMAPDIIELANLLVASDYQNQGLGTRLIKSFEEACDVYQTIFVINSTLWTIPGEEKKSAVPLYTRLDYKELYSTSSTTILFKELR